MSAPVIVQTPAQLQAVEAIITQVQRYLDARQPGVCRMNPNLDRVWDDLAFQGVAQLQITLSNTKAFGPVRYHIAETFLSDDDRRKTDFVSPTHQNSILYEIVEKDDAAGAGKRMEGNLEIHDMRTLFKMIEPAFINTVSLIQTFIWWDFLDAVDMARTDMKANRLRLYREGKITDAVRAGYRDAMKQKDMPPDSEIILYELWQIRWSVESFKFRRTAEPGYKRIVSREYQGQENPETIIRVLANHLALVDHLRAGKPLDPTLAKQMADILKIDQAMLTPDRALAYLERIIPEQKSRLRAVLAGNAPGRPYNLKERQAMELQKRYDDLRGDIEVPEKLDYMQNTEALRDKGTAART